MAKSTTIRDVAEAAGVSAMTVSLALRNSSRVSAATRERIRMLAVEMAYRPHPMVSALMQQVAEGRKVRDFEKIAMISTDSDPEGFTKNEWEARAIRGAREQARDLGFDFEVFWGGPGGRDLGSLTRALYNRGIHGLIFLPMPWPHPTLDVDWRNFSPVTCTLSTGEPRLPCVTSHHHRGTARLIDWLVQRGARSIGMVQFEAVEARNERMFTAAALGAAGAYPDLRIRLGLLPFDFEDRAFMDWFQREPMDVLVAPSRDMNAPRRLKRLGHEIGRTIGYAELDVATDDRGAIAGLFQRCETIGSEAVRCLSQALYRNETGLKDHPPTILIDPEVVDGSSLDCLRAAAGRKTSP
jgi:LacI family transcriptional regulator